MAARVPAKSILKQTPPESKPTLSDEEKAKQERDRKNLAIALHHANIIQHRKNIEAQILSNIEVLLDFPAAASPTQSEASDFVSRVQLFQPSDFDSLVEERRIDRRCGYALCQSTPRSATMGSNAAWKLKNEGAKDYCSNECLRRALYVKSQLSEVPAWEREPGQEPQIVLLEADQAESPSHKRIDARSGEQGPKEELALERGETPSSFRPGQVMTTSIVEKSTTAPKALANTNHASMSHASIEGYEPTSSFELESDTDDMGRLTIDDSVGFDESRDVGAPGTDPDENEAWRDLFDNIGKG